MTALFNGSQKERDMEYNGWSNRETWAAALWIQNDEGLLGSVNDLLAHKDGAAELASFMETLCSAHLYEEEFGSKYPKELSIMAQDIGSLYRVDWIEIAEYLKFEELLQEANND
jgi:hypothetical protein